VTLEFILILTVIAVLSVVQSIFGMGVLIFGTPTLLLMGYDFITTLSYLLPASFAISLLQVLAAGPGRPAVSKHLYLLCLPGISIGLLLVETSQLAPRINALIGIMLLLSAFIRFWAPAQKALTGLLKTHIATYHLVMGFTHGVTNLGGAMLAILASGSSTDKKVIRYTVAHYYLAFSFIQMLLLAIPMGHYDLLAGNSFLAAISSSVYLLIGNRIFASARNSSYNLALTIFIAAYGVVILMKL
jgi:uncharacterized protein